MRARSNLTTNFPPLFHHMTSPSHRLLPRASPSHSAQLTQDPSPLNESCCSIGTRQSATPGVIRLVLPCTLTAFSLMHIPVLRQLRAGIRGRDKHQYEVWILWVGDVCAAALGKR